MPKVLHLLNFVAWIAGVIVSLTVGLAMIQKSLTISFIPSIITVIAGWIVVTATFLTVLLVLFKK